MTQTNNCLNCENLVSEKFCPNCGQNTNTHRINFKHFVLHDILHGVWHFERGLLFTIKEAALRPGKAALEYISGKRIKYYNVFYLGLLLIGLMLLLNYYFDVVSNHIFEPGIIEKDGVSKDKLVAFLESYSKQIIFAFLPLLACNSFIIFRRKKLNLSEHFIIAGMIFLGILVINLIFSALSFLQFIRTDLTDNISDFFNVATPLSLLLFLIYNYYKVFSPEYSHLQMIIRITFFTLFLAAEFVVFLRLLSYYVDL
ncbi:DUF3667 domain-containing protein [Flavobacterium ardleyense]|uniref:DUF3667 domain-containing protein n=1 Tax=Flavobacterium ardleyense TaxID=2038737 RepID=UPI00298C8DE3|nr:DUF3667 domain-containing protein [Flavobacterium ardleyense]